MRLGGFNVSQMSSNVSPSPADKIPVAHGSYKFGNRCQTSSNFAQTMTSTCGPIPARSLGRPRNMRIVDNAQERILKRIED